MSQYVWFEKLPGKLRIHLLPGKKRELKKFLKESNNWFGTWREVFEQQLCNGWDRVDTTQLALWDDCQMLITEELEEDDHGNIVGIGICYTYLEYAIHDELEVLWKRGHVDYTEIDMSCNEEDAA